MTRRDIPNVITNVRMYASLPIILVLYFGWKGAIPWVFATFASTDYVDGKIARKFGWTSEYGRRIDPYADKALCWPAIILAFFEGSFASMLVFPTAVFLIYDIGGEITRRHKIVGAPNAYGKWKTALLMVAIIVLWLGITRLPEMIAIGITLYWIAACIALFAAFDHLYNAGLIRFNVPAIF